MDKEDRELVGGYLRGRDEAAFRALYRRHTPALLGLAARLSGGRLHDAEEIVQEAWVRAAQGLAAFRWQSSLRTWLCGIVVNGWRELVRARRGADVFEDAPRDGAAESAPSDRIDLERAVARLPDGFRAVLVLHDVEGFTHAEIAQLLEIEPGTSKSQLFRARQAMRRRLSAARERKQGEQA